MISLTLGAVADVVGGALVDAAAADVMVTSVTIDSRGAVDGALFFALHGGHADGHDFVDDALGRGAAGAMVEQGRGQHRCVEVDDPADALLGLGAWVRDTVDPL